MYSHFTLTNGDVVLEGNTTVSYLVPIDVNTSFFGDVFTSNNYFDSINRWQLFFGFNFTQSAANIQISKSELTGLTVSTNNSAQSLIVALLQKWLLLKITDEIYNINISLWGAYVKNGKKNIILEINIYDFVMSDENQSIQYPDVSINPNNY